MVSWLVHVVGEADLGLVSQSRHRTEHGDVLASRDAAEPRLADLRTAVAAGDRSRLERLLVTWEWDGPGDVAPGDPPLPRALAVVSALGEPAPDPATPADDGWAPGPDDGIRLLLVATRQTDEHPLDTAAIAQELGAAVRRFPDLLGLPVEAVDVARVRRFGEAGVLEAIRPLLTGAVHRGDRGAVTWGSGATGLALASVTSLVQAGLPWVFIDVPETGPARVVDPLQSVDPDPVTALLVRWRMFRSLAELASGERPPIRLDGTQRAVVERLARRWEQGYQEVTAEALRGLVADAVVRGDGTAGFAVRRYIKARYEELRAAEAEAVEPEAVEPEAVDLLAWAERHGSGRLLGQQLEYLRQPQARELLPPGELDRQSATWLVGETTMALNELGKRSSHELRATSPALARRAARALTAVPGTGVDAAELASVGLPAAPVTPGLTVLATWVVGKHLRKGLPTIGAQLVADQVGPLVRDHLGVTGQADPGSRTGRRRHRKGEEPQRVVTLRVLLIATPDSAEAAEMQARQLRTPPWPELFERVIVTVEVLHRDLPWRQLQDRMEEAVAGQVSRRKATSTASTDLGALVVVPTGLKDLALPLVRAARRESARRGVPMFLRELTGSEGTGPGMHLWPALVEGDLPLLVAAREAVAELELDLAWRLLSATSVAGTLATRYRELRNAFTCTEIDDPDSWPPGLPSPTPKREERTLGLLGERLRLVHAALVGAEQSTPSAALRIRYLMLAAATVEATVGRVNPRRDGRVVLAPVRDVLRQLASERRWRSQRDAFYPLLVLDRARNDIPITHGQQTDPDSAVRAALNTVAAETTEPSPSLRGRLSDVPSLVEVAADSAGRLFTPAPGAPGILERLHEKLWTQLNREINERAGRRDPRPW